MKPALSSEFFNSQFGLQGKRALVTGAGRGIGRAIAEALVAAGAQVAIHFHQSRQPAQELVEQIQQKGGAAWSLGADLTRSDDVSRMFHTIAQRWPIIDILVNNAGDLIQRSPLAEADDDLMDRVMKVNVFSAMYVTRAAVPLLNKAAAPCIVNVGSVAAHNGGANGAAMYAASKGAIHTLTRGLAKELAPKIRVNAIAPGVHLTDFHRTHSTPERLAAIAQSTPLARLGTAEDCAAAVVFLCAPGASFITGEILEINGGLWLA